jgi:PAS domain-containing protein
MPLSDSTSLRRIFDAIPAPILILDTECRVLDHNLAAGEILTLTEEQVSAMLCGESLGCIHAEQSPAGCGSGAPCATCVLRISIGRAGAGRRTVRQPTRMLLRRDATQQHQPVDFLVSASPLSHEDETLVLMMLEDVTELTDLRRIIPVCAQCGKMRDDDQYWQGVQEYLTRYTQVRFTHGLCPECLHALYPDLYGPPEAPDTSG